VVLLLIYVDNLLLTGNDRQLMSKCQMKDLGIIKRYLGVDFHMSDKRIFIHQSKYAIQILCDAGMQDCNLLQYHFC
jgi:hypothetical protein